MGHQEHGGRAILGYGMMVSFKWRRRIGSLALGSVATSATASWVGAFCLEMGDLRLGWMMALIGFFGFGLVLAIAQVATVCLTLLIEQTIMRSWVIQVPSIAMLGGALGSLLSYSILFILEVNKSPTDAILNMQRTLVWMTGTVVPVLTMLIGQLSTSGGGETGRHNREKNDG